VEEIGAVSQDPPRVVALKDDDDDLVIILNGTFWLVSTLSPEYDSEFEKWIPCSIISNP